VFSKNFILKTDNTYRQEQFVMLEKEQVSGRERVATDEGFHTQTYFHRMKYTYRYYNDPKYV